MPEPCPSHPGIILPDMICCPICAQEHRRATYERQRVEIVVSPDGARQRQATLLRSLPAPDVCQAVADATETLSERTTNICRPNQLVK